MTSASHSVSDPAPLRIALLGTGSLGTLMAWHWQHEQLWVIRRDYSRPLILQHDQRDTLTLPRWDGSDLDWLVLTTKAADALPALQTLAPRLAAVKRILLLQNGMGQQDQVGDWLQQTGLPCGLWAGTSTEGAFTDDEGIVHYAGQGQTWAGPWMSESTGKADTDSDVRLPPGVQTDPDIRSRLRAKLAINACINPLTAIYRCRNGELLTNPQYHAHFQRLAAEVQQLTRELGWQLPFDVAQQAAQIAAATARNQSSTLQDILRHRPTELAYITEYLLKEAAAHGLSAPVSEDVRRLTPGGT